MFVKSTRFKQVCQLLLSLIAGTKEETRDKVAVTTVSKLSLDQDHKKQSFETPQMAKKKKPLLRSAKQRSTRHEFVKK